MPIYEYKCEECGTISERLLMGAEVAKDINCFQCGSQRVEKILSTVSIVTKDFAYQHGQTCCGQEERCDSPPCSSGNSCRRA